MHLPFGPTPGFHATGASNSKVMAASQHHGLNCVDREMPGHCPESVDGAIEDVTFTNITMRDRWIPSFCAGRACAAGVVERGVLIAMSWSSPLARPITGIQSLHRTHQIQQYSRAAPGRRHKDGDFSRRNWRMCTPTPTAWAATCSRFLHPSCERIECGMSRLAHGSSPSGFVLTMWRHGADPRQATLNA
jgi:hypothetical protein